MYTEIKAARRCLCLSFSSLAAEKERGGAVGAPWAVTRKLWSCSFMVSCRAFSSWAHRLCASATRSSLQRPTDY